HSRPSTSPSTADSPSAAGNSHNTRYTSRWTDPRAEAKRRRGGWIYSIDPAFDPAGEVPGWGIIGGWQVDHHGALVRFWHNPNYRPSPQARGWPPPQNPLENALYGAASGYGGEEELLTALRDAQLLLFAQPGAANLYTLPGSDGRDVLEACTSPQYVPRHWPGHILLTGQQLAEMTVGLDLRLNPGSRVSVTLPLDDLQQSLRG
ncbi:type VII secretion system-associated protein, partial [Kitasatospora sp. NPDC050543]|uniref:type VII secretion system-associated protein n=1 Tax=Kitasatospora sp. NPDC050543 TaxID=3364054 RepID=UPI0037A52FAE